MGSFSCVCHQISPLLQTRRSRSAILDNDGIQIRSSPFDVSKLSKGEWVLFVKVMIATGGKMTVFKFIKTPSFLWCSWFHVDSESCYRGDSKINLKPTISAYSFLYMLIIQPSFLTMSPLKLLHQCVLSNVIYLSLEHCNCIECICNHGGRLLRETWGWVYFCLSSCLQFCVQWTQIEFLPLPSAWHTILLVPLINPGEEKLPWEAP